MIRTIWFFTRFWIKMAGTLNTSWQYNRLGSQGKLQEQLEFLNVNAREWGRFLFEVTGSEINVIGKENVPAGAVLFVSNHQSSFDIPILAGYLDKPFGFVAKKELENFPIVNTWMRRIKCVFIDRKNPRQAIRALAEATDNLKQGFSMTIFPEGTRSQGRGLLEFKKGSIRLAEKSGVPIIPVTIIDSWKMYEANGKRVKPAKVTMVIDKPIYMDNLTEEDKSNLLQNIKKQIQANLQKYE